MTPDEAASLAPGAVYSTPDALYSTPDALYSTPDALYPAHDAVYSTPDAWWSGPERVYAALSKAVMADHAGALRGRRVLDLGAGTGATSRAVAEVGGRPLAIDESWVMLAHRHRGRAPGAVADACALPFADDSVGASVAAFVLSHAADPVALLREAGRVTAPGGVVIAVTFAVTGARSAVNGIVESLLADRGWVSPPWFSRLKAELEPLVADPGRLVSMAVAAGLGAPVVNTLIVDTGVETAGHLVDWRLGSPGVASFVAGLAEVERRALRSEAVAAVGPEPQPLVVDLRVLSSRATTARRSPSA